MTEYRFGRSVLIAVTTMCFVAALAFPNGLPQDKTAPPGTPIKVRLVEEVSSKSSQVGDVVYSRLAEAMMADGQEIFPVGTQVLGEVKDVKPAGRMWKNGQIEFVMNKIVSNEGQHYSIVANLEGASKFTKDSWKRRLFTIAIAAGAGILVSKIFGGSVLKGLLLGGAAGTGYTLYKKNEDVVLPAGTTINLVLEEAISVTYGFQGGEVIEQPIEEQPIEEQPAEQPDYDFGTPADTTTPTSDYISGTIEVGPSVDVILRSDVTQRGVFTGVTDEGKIIIDVQYGVLLVPVTDVQEMVFDHSTHSGSGLTQDTAYLKGGTTVVGSFRGFAEDKFIFQTQYGEMRVPLDDVGRIVFAY